MTVRPRRPRRSRPDSQRSGGWLITSAVLLGAVPVLGLYLLLTKPSATRPPRQHVPTARLTTSPAPAGPGCNVTGDGSSTALGSVPADLSWVVSNGELTPTSPTAGPMTNDGGVARCFAHDAEGALIASVRIAQQIAEATSSTWPMAAEGLAPGPDSDALRAQMVTLLVQPPAPADTNTPFAAVAGFKFLSYSPTTAVIELVYRTTSGGLYAASQTMQWAGGDWRIAPLGPSELSSPQTSVTSLLGYVQWRQP
jgi:hypothetical protein